LVWPAKGDHVELLGPVDANSEHNRLPSGEVVVGKSADPTEAQRRADGPVLAGRHPLGLQASRAVPGNAVSTKSSRDKRPKRSPRETRG
jgi:hypothetical protein